MAPNMLFILIAILDLIALVLSFVAVWGFGRVSISILCAGAGYIVMCFF